MMKIKRGNNFLVSFMLLLVGIKVAAASPYQDISEIPFLVHLFLVINIFQLSVATAMIQEVKKVSISSLWNNIIIANLFTMVDACTLGLILNRYFLISTIDISISIALFYTFAVFMVNITEYLLIKPLLKNKMNLMRKKYILPYTFFIVGIWYFFTCFISFVEIPTFQYFFLFWLFLFLGVVRIL